LTTRIIVFARAPVPGEAKTRLIPALGAEGAARLHARLVERTLATACAAGVGAVELCCAPDATHPFFAACAARFGVALTAQGAGDLGARMRRALAVARPAVLIGSDCPAMTPDYLRGAAGALGDGCDLVFGPADDGGYVLVGANRLNAGCFERISWGGAEVMATQRLRLRAGGLRWTELAPLWDVDRPGDLERLRVLQPELLAP
jgi:rSAM/selenodomain-associated transferase 1